MMRGERIEAGSAARPISEAPWPVKAYVAVTIVGIIVWVAIVWSRGDTFVSARPAAAIIPLAIAIGLLKGYRAVWVIASLFAALGVIGAASLLMQADQLVPEQWSSLVVWVLSSAVLIHPLTRAWMSR